MCGIVGAIAERNVVPILMEGLRRLEYRGYDSAGMAVLSDAGTITVRKREGKIASLQALLEEAPPSGHLGVGHTRWATHGAPSEKNAHPMVDASERLAVVHNGIVENWAALRAKLTAAMEEVFAGDENWNELAAPTGDAYAWEPDSTYVRNPPYFDGTAGYDLLVVRGLDTRSPHHEPETRQATPPVWNATRQIRFKSFQINK